MTSSYYLAVDVGTSRTAAATARLAPDGSLLALPFALGRNSDSAPSAMFVSGGELLFGAAAERRGIAEPERLVREFKRRIGDDVPIIAGDQRFTAEEIYALMVAWVVDLVTEREARLPSAIAVTVPVAWGDYRTQLVEEALSRHGWSSVTLVTEPEAAARHYESTSPLAPGGALAVYDLGGGTFDAIVLQKDAAGVVQVAGAPVGLGDVGGSDFDDAVLRHALSAAGISPASVATQRLALAALRRECVDAKESLSFDSESVIPVLLGTGHGAVRLTRVEFEDMIEHHVSRTVEALADALESAGVDVDDVESILLTGGSSRIPHIAQVLSERFDRPIAIDADPKAIIALGAVRVLSDRASAPAVAAEYSAPAQTLDTTQMPSEDAGTAPERGTRGKGRRWHLPTIAYVSAGSLFVALGLVVASATAVGDTGSVASAGGSFIEDVLGAGFAADAAQAADRDDSASEAVPSAIALPVDAETPADGAGKLGRRTGPDAGTVERTVPIGQGGIAPSAAAPGGSASGGSAPVASDRSEPSATQQPETTQAPAQTQPPVIVPVVPEETADPAPTETTPPAPTDTPTPTETESPSEPTDTPAEEPAPADPGTDTP